MKPVKDHQVPGRTTATRCSPNRKSQDCRDHPLCFRLGGTPLRLQTRRCGTPWHNCPFHVNGRIVTAVEDRSTGTRRDHVVVPLLSVRQTGSLATGATSGRKSLMPRQISPARSPVLSNATPSPLPGTDSSSPCSSWCRRSTACSCNGPGGSRGHARIAFVAEGKARVASGQLQTELATLVEAVLQRLQQLRPAAGFARHRSPGRMGRHPGARPRRARVSAAPPRCSGWIPSPSSTKRQTLLPICGKHTEPVIREDLLASLDAATLPGAAAWLKPHAAGAARPPGRPPTKNEWGRRPAAGCPCCSRPKPWRQGYALGPVAPPCPELRRRLLRFRRKPANLPCVTGKQPCPPAALKGSLPQRHPHAPSPAANPKPPKRFTLARALGDYIGRSQAGLGLITSMDTARQAQSRAFAAELLAPAQSLRTRLAGQDANEDVISGLGHEFWCLLLGGSPPDPQPPAGCTTPRLHVRLTAGRTA